VVTEKCSNDSKNFTFYFSNPILSEKKMVRVSQIAASGNTKFPSWQYGKKLMRKSLWKKIIKKKNGKSREKSFFCFFLFH